MPRLRALAHSRTGDKGDTSNISVIAYDPADFPRLERHVTAERVKAHFADLVRGEVGPRPRRPHVAPRLVHELVQRPQVGVDQPPQAGRGRGGLLVDDAVELGVRRRHHQEPAHAGSERVGHVGAIARVGDRGGEVAEEPVDGVAPELLLRREVVVDLRLVGPGPLGDAPGGGALEAVGGELHGGGVEEAGHQVGRGPPGPGPDGGACHFHIGR